MTSVFWGSVVLTSGAIVYGLQVATSHSQIVKNFLDRINRIYKIFKLKNAFSTLLNTY